MPYKVVKRAGVYRLVNPRTGKAAKTTNNKAIDGGGHRTESAAKAQVRAILASEAKKKRKK